MRHCKFDSLLLMFLAATTIAVAHADWAKLESGEVVAIVTRIDDSMVVRLPDGKTVQIKKSEVEGVLTDSNAQMRVDRIMGIIGDPKNRDKAPDLLKGLGPAALPRLLHYLKSDRKFEQLRVLVCLQYVWSAEAADGVEALTSARDADVRKLAGTILRVQLGTENIRSRDELNERLVKSPDIEIAGPALREILMQNPDVERMREALTVSGNQKYLVQDLVRYHSRKLGETARTFLQAEDEETQRYALIGLRNQFDGSEDVRVIARQMLAGKEAKTRDIAADYLLLLGASEDLRPLEKAASRERDLHARAAMEEAINAINYRTATYPQDGEPPVIEIASGSLVEVTRSAREALKVHPHAATLKAVWQALSSAREFVPFCQGLGRVPNPDAEQADRALSDLQTILCGYKIGEGNQQVAAGAVPVARKYFPPARDFYDPKRKSFGLIPKNRGPAFAVHHMGDDMSWHQPHSTVVAMADGIVRVARTGENSWGGLVVIEHRTAGGNVFCSLYGHLGPVIAVRPGDRVKGGQRIGALGRTHTRENGGLGTHLHFGINRGAFGPGSVAGYVSPKRFKHPSLRWIDPQTFFRKAGFGK